MPDGDGEVGRFNCQTSRGSRALVGTVRLAGLIARPPVAGQGPPVAETVTGEVAGPPVAETVTCLGAVSCVLHSDDLCRNVSGI